MRKIKVVDKFYFAFDLTSLVMFVKYLIPFLEFSNFTRTGKLTKIMN